MITNIALGMIFKDDEWSLHNTRWVYEKAILHKFVNNFGAERPQLSGTWSVIDGLWKNNYAVARNELIEEVKNLSAAPWLLMLDADEAMFPDDLRSLSRWVETCTADAVYFPRINFVKTPATWLPGNYPDYQTRLIRLGSDVHYVNAVHECSAGSKPRVMAPYHIYHYGLCRPPEVVFERWRSYAALDGKAAPAQMPAGFDDYVGLGPQEPFKGEHPLQGASGAQPASDAQLTSQPAHYVVRPANRLPAHRPRYTPYRLR